jgi:hypothetical protein
VQLGTIDHDRGLSPRYHDVRVPGADQPRELLGPHPALT